jgi:rhomboid-like protein
MSKISFLRKYSRGYVALYSIIGANVGVFCAWQYANSDNWSLSLRRLRRRMIDNLPLTEDGFFLKKHYYSTVTCFFTHFDSWHLAVNMVSLYFFCSAVTAVLGSARFLYLYMISGTVSSLCQLYWPFFIPSSWPARYRSRSYQAYYLGASGAVNSIVTYYILRFPTQIIYLYFVIPVPAGTRNLFYVEFLLNGLLF